MDEVLACARSAIADLQSRSPWAASSEECVAVVDTAQVLVGQLTALMALHVSELDARGWPAKQGASSMKVWLRDRLRISIHAAKRIVELGTTMAARPVIADALLNGAIGPEQATVIAATCADLPSAAGPAVVDKCEAALIEQACHWEPAGLRLLGERILAHVAPEIADEVLRRKLDHDEAMAQRKRGFTLTATGHSLVRLSGTVDTESAAIISAALAPLCLPGPCQASPWQPSPCQASPSQPSPQPQSRHLPSPSQSHPGQSHPDQSNPGQSSPGQSSPGQPQAADDGDRDTRTPAQRRVDALIDICRRALAPTDSASPTQVTVTIDWDALRGRVGAGALDDGQPLSPETIRRLACDAGIVPAVLSGPGDVLDLGRLRRSVGAALRRALAVRDRGCAFPGCDRPARWTDAHHIVHWADGGPTSLANTVLLCRRHHRATHHEGWLVRIADDGMPEFIPPAYVDPLQGPRRNLYHRRT